MRVQSLSPLGLSRYAVREDGIVFNTSRLEFCKPFVNKQGYWRVSLHNDEDREKKYAVNRLVAWAFCPKYNDDLVVNHLDSNPGNNHFTNLEWVTYTENTAHAIQSGNFSFAPKAKKLSDDQVHFIQTSNIGLKQISEMFNVSKSAILYHRNRGVFVKET